MPVADILLTAIADAVFGYAFEKSADKLGEWAREKLKLDPTKKAFKEALGKAFTRLEEQHPRWVADHFDASFFEHEGAPILAQFLVRDGHPDASELAALWADSLNLQQPERRAFYTRELEPVAADFLEDLAHELKSKEALRELHDSRAFEEMTGTLQALRQKLGAEKATAGTRRDYLRWLIGRNLYLDPRGTFQTQRQVQVKLDEVYISLRAQRDETPGMADRHLLEKELADLEMTANLSAEEIEDRREHLQARFERRLATEKQAETLELAAVVTRYDRVVILGDPGSGKTTLLRYLALKHADALWHGRAEAGADLGIAHFPILIRIAEYAEDGNWKKKSLSEFLADSYMLHDCPRNGLADLLQTELEKGNCLVLLDGLDEIVSADERLGVVKQIEDFVRHHVGKANRFVITSRKAGYRSAPLAEPFVHYAVQEMDETQMRRFLERWCQAVEDAQTPELSVQERRNVAKREIESIMRAVQTAPGVRRLAANPLLLRTLALIHRTGAQLPQKRIELYKLAADTLARTWRPAQGVPESALVKEEYLAPLLSTLAYWLHVNKPTGIATEREVYEVLGKEWARLNDMHWDEDDPNPKITAEIRKFLVAVREHTGLFVERAPRRYGFMHLTFEEYYVARHLVARSKTRAKLLRQHLHQPRWEEPILLALGFVGLEYPAEAGELVETAILAEGEEANDPGLTPSQYEDLLGRDYLFALRCLGDNIPVRPKLLKQLIDRLADECLHGTGSAQFQRYRQALDENLAYLRGSKGAFDLPLLLISAISDPDSGVRSNAARSLGLLGDPSPVVISALIPAISDPDYHVRSSAIVSLGQLGDTSPRVISVLTSALTSDLNSVRYVAAWSLGQLGYASPEVASALVSALNYPHFTLPPPTVQSLDPLLSFSPQVRFAFTSALNDFTVRCVIVQTLGQLGIASPQVVSTLTSALADVNSVVRSYAAESLKHLGAASPQLISTQVSALSNADSETRSHAAQSLGELGVASPEVVSALTSSLSDPDGFVRYYAVKSLGQLNHTSPQVVSALLSALSNADSLDRSSIVQSLGQLGDASPEVVSALTSALSDPDAVVRYHAAKSLNLLGQPSPQDVSTLIAALSNTDSSVRHYAIESLGQLKQPPSQAVSALISALSDTNPDLCYRAALSLVRLGQTLLEAMALLLKALSKAEGWGVRSDSAHFLGRIGQGDEATIEALWRGLLDEDYHVRTASAQALAQLGRRFSTITQSLEARFVEAFQDPKFDKPDKVAKRPAYDYAYDGLWSLVVGGELEKA